MNKSLILKEIQSYLGFKKDIDFAEFLGISQSTLSNWHKRGSIDYERIISKCELIDANWLLTGRGEMLKGSYKGAIIEGNEIILQNKLIEMQEKEIGRLEEKILKLKKEKSASEYNLHVAEPSEELKQEPKK
jgi:transcriptional regulator with XRE-family HTH domain